MFFSHGRATTVVKHDHQNFGMTSTPGQSDGCDAAGCYHDKFHYGPKMSEIKSLLDISSECHQVIINNCTNNPLSHLSWWLDRHGNIQEYWHGNHNSGTAGCRCSLENYGCSQNAQGDSVCCYRYIVYFCYLNSMQ